MPLRAARECRFGMGRRVPGGRGDCGTELHQAVKERGGRTSASDISIPPACIPPIPRPGRRALALNAVSFYLPPPGAATNVARCSVACLGVAFVRADMGRGSSKYVTLIGIRWTMFIGAPSVSARNPPGIHTRVFANEDVVACKLISASCAPCLELPPSTRRISQPQSPR